MNKIWVIADIHGRADNLINVWYKLDSEEKIDLTQDKLIFLGDMIDRGPDSKVVLDTVKELTIRYPKNVIALAGNHEWLAIDASLSPTKGDRMYLWLINGGDRTLESFYPETAGKHFPSDRAKILPEEYVKWLASLPLYYETDKYFFSHAPLPEDNDRAFRLQGQPYTKEELTWTYEYEGYGKHSKDGKIGVCGHIHALPELMVPRYYEHYIYADAGCGCHKDAPLVAIELNSRKEVYSD